MLRGIDGKSLEVKWRNKIKSLDKSKNKKGKNYTDK